MIWHPNPGQRVRLNYKNKSMPHQGACGVIRITAQGRGPVNALVLLDTGQRVIVPRGNLIADQA